MTVNVVPERINLLIRIFIYILVFWLPYSNAVVETCVIIAVVLWIVRRGFLMSTRLRGEGWHLGLVLQSLRPGPTVLDGPVAVFLAVAFLSSFLSADRGMALRAFVTKTVEWFAVYYLAAETMTERKHRQILLGVFVVTAVATALDSLFQFYVSGRDIFLGQTLTRHGATAAFSHANGLGAYWTIGIPLTCGLIYDAGSKKMRRILIACLALMAWSLVLTFSRGAWVAVLGGLLIFVFLRSRRACFYLAAGLMGLGLLFQVLCPREVLVKSRLDEGNLTRTVSWRLGIWEDSLKMIRQHPVIGFGVNTYMRHFLDYRRKAWEGPLYGNYTSQSLGPTYAHNCFVQITAELGLLGLFSFLWIIFRFVRNSVTIRPLFLARGKPAALLWFGLLSGLGAYLIHSCFDTDLYALRLSAYFWLILGLTVAMSPPPASGGEKIYSSKGEGAS